MLKKIKVSDARLGMYIHSISAKWLENPFWKKSFKLTEQKDLNTLLNCGLDELTIDTDKGSDIAVNIPSNSETVAPQVENQTKVIKKSVKHVSIQEELVEAKKIHIKTKQAVVSMFNEVRMGNALKVEGAVELVNEINQSMERNSGALLSLIRLKNADEYTYLHSIAVSALMVALGRQLGLEGETLEQVGLGGLLHDIGKMNVPNEVLNKPDKLTDTEFDVVKSHSQKGWEILKSSYDVSDIVLDICLNHHERVDGQGYPGKLSGDALSKFARMGAICDVYDALTSNRCYKKGWDPAQSISKMASWKDGHFDEAIFNTFVRMIGIYPNGTLLKLASERLAVVIEQSEKSMTTPTVKVFFSTQSDESIPTEIVDLSNDADTILSVEDPQQWPFDLAQIQGIS